MRRRQSAQAMIEFLIIIPVLIMLIFGAAQVAFIYSAKNGLNYATFQAARIGAMNHALYSDMRRGLIRGMYPMFSQIDDEKERMTHTATEVDNFVMITRISPNSEAFAQFGEEVEALGASAIPNDNLMFRSPAQGPVSIQDANLLKIRVQYCMRLIVPMAERLFSSASAFNTSKTRTGLNENARLNPDYEEVCGGRNGFIITSEATVRMQSAAINDETYCSTTPRKLNCP
ncbi:TadE family protein [Ectopseudomonas mendocina]|uniref:TadE family protein n=1 Tax=Ectopseudomonas mendocina TaxID=300 RepID=A0ABZ2REZ3_ECTME